jgi:hypothetical protein
MGREPGLKAAFSKIMIFDEIGHRMTGQTPCRNAAIGQDHLYDQEATDEKAPTLISRFRYRTVKNITPIRRKQ